MKIKKIVKLFGITLLYFGLINQVLASELDELEALCEKAMQWRIDGESDKALSLYHPIISKTPKALEFILKRYEKSSNKEKKRGGVKKIEIAGSEYAKADSYSGFDMEKKVMVNVKIFFNKATVVSGVNCYFGKERGKESWYLTNL